MNELAQAKFFKEATLYLEEFAPEMDVNRLTDSILIAWANRRGRIRKAKSVPIEGQLELDFGRQQDEEPWREGDQWQS